MTEARPVLRAWLGPAVLAAGVVTTLEGVLRGADVVAAVVGGGLAGGLLLLAAAGTWLLLGIARALLPRAWRSDPLAAAVVVALAVFVVGIVQLAAAIAARHRDPAMIAVTVAVLGTVLAWSAIAIVVPLATRVAVRAGPWGTKVPRPRWLPALGRAAMIAAVVWASGSIARRAMLDPPRLRGLLAVGALHVWVVVTDFDGDGSGLLSPRRDHAR